MAKGYTLLRLKPGPAEAEFGITAAPMAAISDWHGRVLVRRPNLRGSIPAACTLLDRHLDGFDRRAAARPPAELPEWARPLLGERGPREMLSLLTKIHGRKKPKFGDLVKVYESLDVESRLIAFCGSYLAATAKRVPKYGTSPEGYEDEVRLLESMTFCVNDSIKFRAIDAWAEFAPVGRVAFLVSRAEKKAVSALNPNVVWCRCLGAIGKTAKRFPGARDRASVADRDALVATLPALADALRTASRNNGACRLASESIVAILEATHAPEALGAYLENFLSPGVTSDWLRDYTAKYHARCVPWVEAATGQKLGTDHAAWRKWYAAHEDDLVYSPESKRFRVDAKGAKAARKRLAKLRKKR
ncbi:MAG: hypothetical protein ABFS86_06445 [Planctomycetota bacterium]